MTRTFAPTHTGPLTLIFIVRMPHAPGIARESWGRPCPARSRCPEDPWRLQGQEGPKAIGESQREALLRLEGRVRTIGAQFTYGLNREEWG